MNICTVMILKAWHRLNSLSIDVALGSVASSIFFSTVFQKQVSPLVLVALGLSVYTADHLLDVRKSKRIVVSLRHSFHQTNYQQIKRFFYVAAALNLVIVALLPTPIIYAGAGLGVSTTAYFLFHKNLGTSKELIAAIFYTSGVCLPTVTFLEGQISIGERLLLIQFSTTALVNLILFALMEREEDKANRFTSIATLKGNKQTFFLLVLLLVVSVGLFLYQLQTEGNWKPSAILFLMDFILCLLFVFRRSAFVRKYYRLVGDGVFLLPLLVLLL
jgi:4-hydroxybenzoate polyprenyltransferase